jgi:hypothetical protein
MHLAGHAGLESHKVGVIDTKLPRVFHHLRGHGPDPNEFLADLNYDGFINLV